MWIYILWTHALQRIRNIYSTSHILKIRSAKGHYMCVTFSPNFITHNCSVFITNRIKICKSAPAVPIKVCIGYITFCITNLTLNQQLSSHKFKLYLEKVLKPLVFQNLVKVILLNNLHCFLTFCPRILRESCKMF